MATFHGKDGSITSSGTAVASLTEWTYNETATLADKTAMGDTGRSHAAGIPDGTLTCSGVFDPDDTAQDDLRAGASITAVCYPEGNTTGNPTFTGTVVVESFEVTGSLDDMVRFNVTAKGVMTEGTAP